MQHSIKPIGTDVVERSEFRFGAFRYIVERYRHPKTESDAKDGINLRNLMFPNDDEDKRIGTKIYRFEDHPLAPNGKSVSLAVVLYAHLTDDEVKAGLLSESIQPQTQDPHDYEEHFLPEDVARHMRVQKENVKLPYPELKDPYDRCPCCGCHLDPDETTEPLNAEDSFNGCSGFDGEYECCSWQEVHRCPECGKRFYIEASN